MREAQETAIGGRTFSVTPLPAMRALRLWPLVARGFMTEESPLTKLSADEIETLARGLLALARVDGPRGEAAREVFVVDARHRLRMVQGDAPEATPWRPPGGGGLGVRLRTPARGVAVTPAPIAWPAPPRDPRPAA